MRRKALSTSRALADWIGASERARLRNGFRWLFLTALVAYLAVILNRIGWAELWATRPQSPWFYAFVLLAYFTLPLADTFIYRLFWRVPFRSMLAASLRKRIYNSALVGYSGEVFLLLWARGRVDSSSAQIAHEIKDTNILSALVSNYVAAGLIVYLLLQDASWRAAGPAFEVWVIVTLAIALLTPVAFLFRRHFFVLSTDASLRVLGIHTLRFFIVQAFILGQWRAEMPEIGLATLMSLLAVQLLVSRIPMIPSRDLLFISIGIAMSGVLELPQAQIASLLFTTTALQQVLHLVVIVATSVRVDEPAQSVAPRATARSRAE